LGVVRLAVICGPTAAGKSALAQAMAEARGVGILSADSRQVYRRFDIGTAKPSRAEQQRVRYAGIDVVDPSVRYSAAQWMRSVDDWCEALRVPLGPPLVVGGTGMYLRTLEHPLFEEPEMDPAERARLESELSVLSLEAIRERCRRIDPGRAHLGRTQLLRAIEVAELTGRPISAWHVSHPRATRYAVRYLLVDPGKVLQDRIVSRVREMLDGGWVEEVQRLREVVPPEAPAWNATGYTVIRQVVEGSLSLAEGRERVIIATRQYAKRQRTWFRHQLPADRVLHLCPDDRGSVARALAWLDEEAPT